MFYTKGEIFFIIEFRIFEACCWNDTAIKRSDIVLYFTGQPPLVLSSNIQHCNIKVLCSGWILRSVSPKKISIPDQCFTVCSSFCGDSGALFTTGGYQPSIEDQYRPWNRHFPRCRKNFMIRIIMVEYHQLKIDIVLGTNINISSSLSSTIQQYHIIIALKNWTDRNRTKHLRDMRKVLLKETAMHKQSKPSLPILYL